MKRNVYTLSASGIYPMASRKLYRAQNMEHWPKCAVKMSAIDYGKRSKNASTGTRTRGPSMFPTRCCEVLATTDFTTKPPTLVKEQVVSQNMATSYTDKSRGLRNTSQCCKQSFHMRTSYNSTILTAATHHWDEKISELQYFVLRTFPCLSCHRSQIYK